MFALIGLLFHSREPACEGVEWSSCSILLNISALCGWRELSILWPTPLVGQLRFAQNSLGRFLRRLQEHLQAPAESL